MEHEPRGQANAEPTQRVFHTPSESALFHFGRGPTVRVIHTCSILVPYHLKAPGLVPLWVWITTPLHGMEHGPFHRVWNCKASGVLVSGYTHIYIINRYRASEAFAGVCGDLQSGPTGGGEICETQWGRRNLRHRRNDIGDIGEIGAATSAKSRRYRRSQPKSAKSAERHL